MDCKHGINGNDCFDCNTPHRIRYEHRGDTRYRTRSAEVSTLTDGLNHEAQWTPPPGSTLEADFNREHVIYFNRQHGEWMVGSVAPPPEIPQRDNVPTWAQGQDGYEIEEEWMWHPVTPRPKILTIGRTYHKNGLLKDPGRKVNGWGADNRVEAIPQVPTGINRKPWPTVGFGDPDELDPEPRPDVAYIEALLRAVATVRKVTGREWVDSDDVEIALNAGHEAFAINPIHGYLEDGEFTPV